MDILKLLGMETLIYPKPLLLIGLFLLVVFDLISGVRKSSLKGEATTSKGLRQTVDKFLNYTLLVLSLLVVFNITGQVKEALEYSNMFGYSINTLVFYLVYIEVKSILENLIEINSDKKGKPNDFAVSLLIPLHSALILKFKKR